MAPQLSEQEQLAQVRRMQRLRPQTSAAVVAEGASRTPNITRYIRANERRLEPAGGDTSSVATTPNTSAIQKHFATSRLIDAKNEVLTNNASNVLLPHTPFTSGREIKRFPQVKGRRNIYELPEDNSSVFTPAPVLQATPNKPAPATALQSEPLTTSFQYPDTPSSAPREDSQTFEECLNVARKASQMGHKESSKPQSQHPVEDGFGSRINETVTTRTQEIPPNPRQEEQLTKLDMEILRLGEDNQDFASAASPSSLERARMAIQKEHHDNFGQFVDDADGESDAHSEGPPKKRRRSSRQIPNVVSRHVALQELNNRRRSKADGRPTGKKSKVSKVYGKSKKPQKKKRRLPVSELITVNERPGNCDVEITGSRQVELSQDPISQQTDESDSNENEEYYKPGLRLKININSRKRFGAIDIALFRIPKHQDPAPARSGHKKSYSDGFEGKEAAPIGLYMPVKHPTRRRESYKKLKIKLGKLTLVPERPLEERQAEPQHRPSRKQRRRRVVKSVPNAHVESGTAPGHREHREPSSERPVLDESLLDNVLAEHDEDQMLIDGPDKEIAADIGVPKSGLKEQNTPGVPSIGATSETPEHLISPLKRKQSAADEDMIAVGNLQGSQKPASQTPQGHLTRKEDDTRISQHRAATSIIKKTPISARTESLDVANELMMVSVQRGPRESKYDTDSSEKDGDSERKSAESYLEPDNEDEDGYDEASEEYDEDLTQEEDSEQGEEDRDAAEEESQPRGLVAEIVADRAGSGNTLQNSLRDGIQVARERVEMPISSEVGRNVGTRNKFPLVNQQSQITHGGPSDARLKQMALQALQEIETAELERQSQIEPASHGSSGQEAKGQAITIPKQYRPEEIHLEQNDDPDPSWRPRMPNTRGPAMEVDEDIVDSPTPTASQSPFSVHRRSSRPRSGVGGQQLTMVCSHPHIPIPEEEPADERDTQGSVELGQQQGNGRHSPSDASPERQSSKHLEIPETQFSVEPQMSYMERALSQLNEPNSVPRSRTKSMPARAFFAQTEYEDDGMLAGGITMSAAFHHTVSPPKSGSRLPSLLEESPAQEKTLKALKRQASLSMGTMPGSARKRTPSLQLKPPFLRSTM